MTQPTSNQSVDTTDINTKVPGQPNRQDNVSSIILDLQKRVKTLEDYVSSSITPSGLMHSGDAAGGDLGSTYPNPTLVNTPTARAHLGLGSAATQNIGRTYGVRRDGAQYGLAAGWQGIAWDTYDLDGSNAEGLWTGQWVTNATGLWELVIHVFVINGTGSTIEMAVGYNSTTPYSRFPMASSYYYSIPFVKTLYLGAGATINPTVWISAIAGFGVGLLPSSFTTFKRVG